MKKFKKQFLVFYKKNKHLLWLLYFLIYLPWFNILEKKVTTEYHVIHTPLDDWIPFCEYFVIPYLLWFGYVAWGLLYMAFHNVKDYYKLCTVLFTGMTVFLIISTIYPNGHNLRPVYFSHHNFYTLLVEKLYATDTSTNLFPSIHVYNSLAVEFAVLNNENLKQSKMARFLSTVLCVSIILATMFLKQHSTFDVLTAFVLAFIMYFIVYKKPLMATNRKAMSAEQRVSLAKLSRRARSR